jgi:hypothetical protein
VGRRAKRGYHAGPGADPHPHSDTHAHGDALARADALTDTDTYSDSNAYGHAVPDPYGDPYGDADTTARRLHHHRLHSRSAHLGGISGSFRQHHLPQHR